LRLLLNNFEAHLDFSSVYSVSPWLNDLFSGESFYVTRIESLDSETYK